jgi:hypothetical protein
LATHLMRSARVVVPVPAGAKLMHSLSAVTDTVALRAAYSRARWRCCERLYEPKRGVLARSCFGDSVDPHLTMCARRNGRSAQPNRTRTVTTRCIAPTSICAQFQRLLHSLLCSWSWSTCCAHLCSQMMIRGYTCRTFRPRTPKKRCSSELACARRAMPAWLVVTGRPKAGLRRPCMRPESLSFELFTCEQTTCLKMPSRSAPCKSGVGSGVRRIEGGCDGREGAGFGDAG